MPQQENTAVGKITRLFGSAGELQVKLYDIFPDDFQLTEPLFVEIDNLTVPFFCDMFERRGQSSATVRFADIDNDYRAQELIGREIMLPFEDESADTEDPNVYFEDMIGYLAIIDEKYSGTVTDFIEGENPLIQITIGGREILVPAVSDFVADVDTKKRFVALTVPQGLLDLYL